MSVDPLNPRAQLGSLIDGGRIRLVSILGEGSFAVVFLGRDTASNASYAVKCLYKMGLSKDQLALQLREADMLASLAHHPHVVRLHKTLQTPDFVFLVLERCQTDLFDAIMRCEGFSEPAARRLFAQLVDAVAAAHAAHIFHRDLKPENVLIAHPGDAFVESALAVKLTDFGLATSDALSTEFGCGSVRYMAPECLASNAAGRSTTSGAAASMPGALRPAPYSPAANDVWSLGVILINLLTGKNPWVEPSPKDKHF
ncbi:kinase-like domain-containing protein, partial [Entophlyctis helioformis]